jgi:transposase-like protein
MIENRSEVVVPDLVVSRRRNGRCVYSVQAKRALVEACRRPGVSVARMALIHGLNANLLRKWIGREQRKREVAPRASASKAVALLPVRAIEESLPAKRPVAQREMFCPESCIEIVLCAATVRLRGRVDMRQLREVIDCVIRRP